MRVVSAPAPHFLEDMDGVNESILGVFLCHGHEEDNSPPQSLFRSGTRILRAVGKVGRMTRNSRVLPWTKKP